MDKNVQEDYIDSKAEALDDENGENEAGKGDLAALIYESEDSAESQDKEEGEEG